MASVARHQVPLTLRQSFQASLPWAVPDMGKSGQIRKQVPEYPIYFIGQASFWQFDFYNQQQNVYHQALDLNDRRSIKERSLFVWLENNRQMLSLYARDGELWRGITAHLPEELELPGHFFLGQPVLAAEQLPQRTGLTLINAEQLEPSLTDEQRRQLALWFEAMLDLLFGLGLPAYGGVAPEVYQKGYGSFSHHRQVTAREILAIYNGSPGDREGIRPGKKRMAGSVAGLLWAYGLKALSRKVIRTDKSWPDFGQPESLHSPGRSQPTTGDQDREQSRRSRGKGFSASDPERKHTQSWQKPVPDTRQARNPVAYRQHPYRKPARAANIFHIPLKPQGMDNEPLKEQLNWGFTLLRALESIESFTPPFFAKQVTIALMQETAEKIYELLQLSPKVDDKIKTGTMIFLKKLILNLLKSNIPGAHKWAISFVDKLYHSHRTHFHFDSGPHRYSLRQILTITLDRVARYLNSPYPQATERSELITAIIAMGQHSGFQRLEEASPCCRCLLFTILSRHLKENQDHGNLKALVKVCPIDIRLIDSLEDRVHREYILEAYMYWVIGASITYYRSPETLLEMADSVLSHSSPYLHHSLRLTCASLELRSYCLYWIAHLQRPDAKATALGLIADFEGNPGKAFDTHRYTSESKRNHKEHLLLNIRTQLAHIALKNSDLKTAEQQYSLIAGSRDLKTGGSLPSVATLKCSIIRTRIAQKTFMQKEDRQLLIGQITALAPYIDHYEGTRLEVAHCYEQLGDLKASERLLKDYDGCSPRMLLTYTCLLSRLGRYQKATELLQEAMHKPGLSPSQVNLHLAITYNMWVENTELSDADKKQYLKEALRYSRKTYTLGPKSKAYWSLLHHLCHSLNAFTDSQGKHIIPFHRNTGYLPEDFRKCGSWLRLLQAAHSIAKSRDDIKTAIKHAASKATGGQYRPESYQSRYSRRHRPY